MSDNRTLTTKERCELFEKIGKSSSQLGSQSKRSNDSPDALLLKLREVLKSEQERSANLEKENQRLSSLISELQSKITNIPANNVNNNGTIEEKHKKEETPAKKEEVKQERPKAPNPQLRKNFNLISVSCPENPHLLAVWVNESGKAASHDVASQGKGYSPEEVSQIEKRYLEEQSSKLHLNIEKHTAPPRHPHQASHPPASQHAPSINENDSITLNSDPSTTEIIKNTFSYNISLNKKIEAEHKKKGFVNVESMTNVVISSPPKQGSASEMEKELSSVNQSLAKYDLSQNSGDVFQYNIQLNKKIQLESDLKQTTAPPSTTSPRAAPVSPGPKQAQATSLPPGYIAKEIQTVVGKQIFFVKADGVSVQNEKKVSSLSKLKLFVDPQNLPLAAYAIILLANAKNQFPFEKSTQTHLESETSRITGFSAIARFMTRKFDSLNLYSRDPFTSTEIDSFVDLAIGLKKHKKLDNLHKVESVLKTKKTKFLVGDALTLADLIIWDAIRSLELNDSVSLTPGVSSWYKDLNSKPQLAEAVAILTSSGPSPSSASSLHRTVISSAEKQSYISRVMKDFGISQAEAEEYWTKYMGPLLPQEPSSTTSDGLATRQTNILNQLSSLEERTNNLMKCVSPDSLTGKEKLYFLQTSNLDRLAKLVHRLDQLENKDPVMQVKKLQEDVLNKLLDLEKKTRWIDQLGGNADGLQKLDTNMKNLAELEERIKALEAIYFNASASGCSFCHSEVSIKDYEFFSSKNQPICINCYVKGAYITDLKRKGIISISVEKGTAKKFVPRVTEKDGTDVHYYLALSGISESAETDVVVEKLKTKEDRVLSPAIPTPKVPMGAPKKQQQQQPGKKAAEAQPYNREKELEEILKKQDSNVLYYLAINGLTPQVSSSSGSKESANKPQKENHPKEQKKQQKEEVKVATKDIASNISDPDTLYYLALSGLLGQQGSSQTFNTPIEHVQFILNSEFSKYKETTLNAKMLNPSTPQQKAFIETWLQLYLNPSKSEIDNFVVSQVDQFTSFGPIAFVLKNLLFSKTFPRDQ